MRVIVGSRTTRERYASGSGLSVYEVDPSWSQWALRQTLDLVNPSFLVVHPSSPCLYTVHGDHFEVSRLSFDKTAHLSLSQQIPTCGRNPVHLAFSEQAEQMLVANYATGSMSALPVAGDGQLSERVCRLQFAGTPGPLLSEQTGSHPHQVLPWPGTPWVLVPDKGLDRVHVVHHDGNGQLRLHDALHTHPGAGPRHAAMDVASGRFWLCNELDATLSSGRFDTVLGKLTIDHTVSLASPRAPKATARAAGVAYAGGWLYVTVRGHETVVALQVNPDTGVATPRQWQSTLGTTPRFLTLTPDGHVLLVTNETSHTIVRYAIGAEGLLGDGQVVAGTGSPVCIAFASPITVTA